MAIVTSWRVNTKRNKEKRGHDKDPWLSVFYARVFVQFDVIDPVAKFQQLISEQASSEAALAPGGEPASTSGRAIQSLM